MNKKTPRSGSPSSGLVFAVTSALLLMLLACQSFALGHDFSQQNSRQASGTIRDIAEDSWQGKIKTGEELWALNTELEEVTERSYFLLSFANVFVLKTSEGLVLIDTGSFVFAEETHAKIRKVLPNIPVHSVVYTHGHYDHVFGVSPFDEEADKQGWARPKVIAHSAIVERFKRYDYTNGYNSRINSRQFQANSGGVLFELPLNFRYPDIVYSTPTFELTIGGDQLELNHGRGETDDATWVWLPKQRIVCTGDFFIWSSPNAGNPQKVQRYALDWADALDKMRSKNAELLVPGHGPPIFGAERVATALKNTADYLRSLQKQTIDLMNDGKRLNEVIFSVQPPPELLNVPYLRPTYDDPEFVVRNIWRMYGGWWDASPASLKPPRDADLGKEISDIAGSPLILANRALALAKSSGDIDSNLRVATSLVEFARSAAPNSNTVAKIYAEVLQLRADREPSLMARNTFKAASREFGPSDDKEDDADADSLLGRLKSALFGLSSKAEVQSQKISACELSFKWFDDFKAKKNEMRDRDEYGDELNPAMESLKQLISAPRNEEANVAQSALKWTALEVSDGVEVDYTEKDGFEAFRGTTIVNYPPKVVMTLIVEQNYRALWDPSPPGSEEREIQKLDESISIRYQLIPGRLMIAGRELCYITRWKYSEEGHFDAVATSLSSVNGHDKVCPITPEATVRMTLLAAGIRVEPVPSLPNASKVTYVFWADTKGLPPFINRQVGTKKVKNLAKLKEIISP